MAMFLPPVLAVVVVLVPSSQASDYEVLLEDGAAHDKVVDGVTHAGVAVAFREQALVVAQVEDPFAPTNQVEIAP